jgi:DNA modification methylase
MKTQRAKYSIDTSSFISKLNETKNERKIIEILQDIGRLSTETDAEPFLKLLENPSADIRLWTLKNLAKIKPTAFLSKLIKYANAEKVTLVRREAVSVIGRMRSEEALPFCIEVLKDEDSKVVMQAIRALLTFKKRPEVLKALTQQLEHPSELVRAAVKKELSSNSKKNDSAHSSSMGFLKNVLIHSDVREAIKEIPDESVHLTFTSPPYYNARDYTLYKSYDEYLEFLVEVFKEVHRVTKEGRFFVLNTSPVIVPRMSRSHSSTRYLIPYDIHPMLRKIGWDFIEDINWVKPEPSVRNRNGGFFQHRKPLGYKANSISESVIVYRKHTEKLIDWNMKQYPADIIEASKVKEIYEKTNIWKIAPSNDKVHPATFPKELATRVIQFYSFVGDLVFDPFGGSGTTGIAAHVKQRNFLLVEQEGDYVNRIKENFDKQTFFGDSPLKIYNLENFQHLEKT